MTGEKGRDGIKEMVARRTDGRAPVNGNGGSDFAGRLEAAYFSPLNTTERQSNSNDCVDGERGASRNVH